MSACIVDALRSLWVAGGVPVSDARDLKQDVDRLLKDGAPLERNLRDISIQIHNHPELGYNEHFAYNLLTAFMKKHGFKVMHHACDVETAFIASFEFKNDHHSQDDVKNVDSLDPLKGTEDDQLLLNHDGKVKKKKRPLTVGFCAEYDALPSLGHACGHNLIAIAGVAAAIVTKEIMIRYRIVGKVVLFGTPAEEGGGGKVKMLDYGAFNHIDFCMMLHPNYDDNSIPQCLATQELELVFIGKAAHAAASPWDGINALDAICLAFTSMGMLRQQLLPTTRIHGIITDGGKAPNIIPDRSEGKIIIRTQSLQQLHELLPRVVHCFTAAATATGCQMDVAYQMSYHNMMTNMILKQLYQDFMTSYGVKWRSDDDMCRESAGSTDFGNITHVLPGLHPMFYLGIPGATPHTKEFVLAARTETAHWHTMRAVKGLVLTALTVLREPHKYMSKIRKEFKRQKQHDNDDNKHSDSVKSVNVQ